VRVLSGPCQGFFFSGNAPIGVLGLNSLPLERSPSDNRKAFPLPPEGLAIWKVFTSSPPRLFTK